MGLTHGAFVGTPAFASPEQFTNAPVEVRSDIYSLGATLWYLLTGQMPFPGRERGRDSRSPAAPCSSARTTEGRARSALSDFSSHLDARPRAGRSSRRPRAHDPPATLPRASGGSVEPAPASRTCGRAYRAGKCACLCAFATSSGAFITARTRSHFDLAGQEHRGVAV